ncbi:MAG: hypothetical protein NZV14_09860 [Bryobacteraceae bacterium]|nr:hypothetical protein [Bryobacteraceae bacterium]MDW8378456.1 hypothetical protein [Bryobacterales bacterium]
MSAARELARKILEAIPNRDIGSKTDGELFTRYTNTPHSVLQANWDKGGIMTACNGFTGWYSATLGRPGLGVFDLKGVAGRAFIESGKEALPQYGDVFRSKTLHVGVCLECDGKTWKVIHAGQGGKSVGQDILGRRQGPFQPENLLGWVDIELWLDPGEMRKSQVQKALRGAWQVEIQETKRWYKFDSSQVISTNLKGGQPRKGHWEVDENEVTIHWEGGVTEKWPLPVPGLYKTGEGTWHDRLGNSGVTKYRHAW